MRYQFVMEAERCVGCGACAVACMDQNDRDPLAGIEAFRRIEKTERLQGDTPVILFRSIACLHCEPAPCIDVCPQGCLSKKDGLTVCDDSACIGCRACRQVCPVQAPVFEADGRMRKCDGCIDRLHAGLEPACVRSCPYGVLRVICAE